MESDQTVKGTRGTCRQLPAALLAAVLLLLLVAPSHAADFIQTFAGATKGGDLVLAWEGVDPRHAPLAIRAVVVNRTGEENRANVFRRNLAVGINGTSWVWKDMPSPLPYIATALYQVEIRPETQANVTAGDAPVFPRSPYFSIMEGRSSKPTENLGVASPTRPPISSGGSGPSSKTVSLAVGIVVTLVILLLAGTGCFCWRRRYLRVKKGKKRENKFDVVID